MKKRIILWVFLSLNTILIIGSAKSIYELWHKRDIVVEREAVLSRLEAENRQLKTDLEESLTDEFVEREARDKLGLARPGDTVVLVERIQTATDGSALAGEPREPPTFTVWWKLFF